jgi:hypothetical protein
MTNEMQLALGRILRMGSRPYQDGDFAEYERCRAIFMDAAEAQGIKPSTDSSGDSRPGWNFGNSVVE